MQRRVTFTISLDASTARPSRGIEPPRQANIALEQHMRQKRMPQLDGNGGPGSEPGSRANKRGRAVVARACSQSSQASPDRDNVVRAQSFRDNLYRQGPVSPLPQHVRWPWFEHDDESA